MKSKQINNILKDDIEYIIITNTKTKEDLAKITQFNIDTLNEEIVIRIKFKEKD